MRKEEMIKAIEEMGFEVKETDDNILILQPEKRLSLVATVGKNNTRIIDTTFDNYIELDEMVRVNLYTYLIYYSFTKLEEREDKLYYLKTSKENLSRYLNYESLTGEYYLDSEIGDEYRQTKFTFDEIDDLPQIYQDLMFLEVLEIVEVEEE